MSPLPELCELGAKLADSENITRNDGQVQAFTLQQTLTQGRPGQPRADLRPGFDRLQKQFKLWPDLQKRPGPPLHTAM